MPFIIGDIVDTAATVATQRQGGRIRYCACFGATMAGGRVCDKKICVHSNARDYVWVLWNGLKTTISYHETELVLVQGVKSAISKSDANTSIQPEEKAIIVEKFDEIEKTEKLPDDGIDRDRYNGFDKRWASKKAYPEKRQLRDDELDADFWRRYNYGNAPIDRRTLK
jgi:hypothetical protein